MIGEEQWIYILYLAIIINTFGLLYLVLKSWLMIRARDLNEATIKGNTVRISQLKKKVMDLEDFLTNEGVAAQQQTPALGGGGTLTLPDTLEQAITMFDIDGGDALANPIIKPTAEKIYQQIKDKMNNPSKGGASEDMNVGY